MGATLVSQLGVDDHLELGEAHRASIADAVDDEAGRFSHPQAFGQGEIFVHLAFAALRYASLELGLIRAGGYLIGLGSGEELIVSLPIFALCAHALGD